MRKNILMKVILYGIISVIIGFSTTGCLALAAREAFKDKLDEPAVTESPSASDENSSGEKDGKWSLGDATDDLAHKIGSSIGGGMKDFAEDLGTAMGNDMRKVGDSSVTPLPTEPGTTPVPDTDYLKELEHNEFGQIVDAVKEKTDEVVDDIKTATDNKKDTDKTETGENDNTNEPILEGPYHIYSVVDGDTVKLKEFYTESNGKKEYTRYRLVGVNTEESAAPDEYLAQSGKENNEQGKSASNFMKELLGKDQEVFIQYDVQRQDKYGRELVYLYAVKDDGLLFVNKYLVSEGMAQIMTVPPNVLYVDEFVDAQKYARENGKGFWGTGFYTDEE